MINKGSTVTFLPEWQDEGDANIVFIAKEDEMDGMVLVEAQLGLWLNPTSLVHLYMIEGS